MPLLPRHLAAGFGLYFAVIAWQAWLTAQGTTSAWFGPAISLWTYTVNFIGALILGGGLVLAGAASGRKSVDLDMLRGKLSALRSRLVSLEIHARGEVKEDEVETLLASLEDDPADQVGAVAAAESLVADIEHLLPPKGTERLSGSRNPRKRPLGTLGGPVSACAVLAALSAAMLPAADGFLQTNFVLNTFFILAIAYGWIGLLGYALGSVFLVVKRR